MISVFQLIQVCEKTGTWKTTVCRDNRMGTLATYRKGTSFQMTGCLLLSTSSEVVWKIGILMLIFGTSTISHHLICQRCSEQDIYSSPGFIGTGCCDCEMNREGCLEVRDCVIRIRPAPSSCVIINGSFPCIRLLDYSLFIIPRSVGFCL